MKQHCFLILIHCQNEISRKDNISCIVSNTLVSVCCKTNRITWLKQALFFPLVTDKLLKTTSTSNRRLALCIEAGITSCLIIFQNIPLDYIKDRNETTSELTKNTGGILQLV